MSDVTIVTIILSISGFAVAILTHIKTSDCMKGFFKIETRTPPIINTPNSSPQIQKKETII